MLPPGYSEGLLHIRKLFVELLFVNKEIAFDETREP